MRSLAIHTAVFIAGALLTDRLMTTPLGCVLATGWTALCGGTLIARLVLSARRERQELAALTEEHQRLMQL